MSHNATMMVKKLTLSAGLLSCMFSSLIAGSSFAATTVDQAKVVDASIKPLLKKYNIAGMAIAVSLNGENYFYNYGVASKATGQPVTNATLFEIGSISKTLVATLTSYAQQNGQLELSQPVSRAVPELAGSSFDHVSLINLGTHTAGYFPLQLPDNINDYVQLMDYYKHWQPRHAIGSTRTYANPGIGLLGIAAARSMHMSIEDAMEKTLFPLLGMQHSYINVPADQMNNYAQGYNDEEKPVRVHPGVLEAEAYGVKTNTLDLIRYLNANMSQMTLPEKLQRAITATHIGYFKAGPITQDLVWEQYPDSAKLKQIVAGNSPEMLNEMPATKLTPPLAPQVNVYINKTGSTGGFSAYVLYAPARKIGIVMLANKSYPNAAKVTAGYEILKRLEVGSGK